MNDQFSLAETFQQDDEFVVESIRYKPIAVSSKTVWSCVEVKTKSGLSGVGEATIFQSSHDIGNSVSKANQRFSDLSLETFRRESLPAGWADCAVHSAIEQAYWDILGKACGKPSFALLGRARTDGIPLYANINRRTVDRSPSGFIESVRRALDAGFSKLKIAPFDGLSPNCDDEDTLFQLAVDRIRAAHDALQGGGTLLVDCHWRLSRARAEDLLTLATDLKLGWIECPMPENADNLKTLRDFKEECASAEILVAGGEQGTSLGYFEKILDEGVYDIIMPDVKYAGGLTAMLKIAELSAKTNTLFSPHNPSGPVAHLASLHTMMAAGHSYLLEHQFDEDPKFWSLNKLGMPQISNSLSASPKMPGLGFSF